MMAYSLDLRRKVIKFVQDGGSITKASKRFNVGRTTIYRWLSKEDLESTKVESCKRKIKMKELEKDVEINADTKLKEKASNFGVTLAALIYRFKKMKITRKNKSFTVKVIIKNE
jgi:putative transposase